MHASTYLFILSFAFALSFGAVFHHEDIIRKSLLEILEPGSSSSKTPTHEIFQPLELNARQLKNKASNFNKSGMSSDLIISILVLLSFDDILNASLTCANLYNASYWAYFLKLKRIIPNFPEDRRMIIMFATFLREQKIENAFIPDSLEMLTFYFVNQEFVSKMSRNVNKLILSLCHEVVYGPDAIVPATIFDWRFSLIQKLIKNFKLDQTKHFYLTKLINCLVAPKTLIEERESVEMWKRTIGFFSQSLGDLNIADLDDHFSHFSEKNNDSELIIDGFYGFYIWNLPFMDTRRRDSVTIEFMFDNNAFSQYFWDEVSTLDDLLLPHFNNRSAGVNYRWNKELVKKFLGNRIKGLTYLLTRDSSNPFDLQDLLSMNTDMKILMK